MFEKLALWLESSSCCAHTSQCSRAAAERATKRATEEKKIRNNRKYREISANFSPFFAGRPEIEYMCGCSGV